MQLNLAMAIQCVAVGNELLSLKVLEGYIEKTPALQLVNVFEDAVTAVAWLAKHPADLLFIDTQASGIDAVRNLANNPMIIFITHQPKFGFEGFELQAIDSLVKPVEFDRFRKAVAKAEEYYKFQNSVNDAEEYLYVYSDYKLVKIDLNDIEFIESLEEYVRIHITNDNPILSLMPLKRVLQKLPPEKFKRVHRSYVVSVNKIKGVNNKRIKLAAAEVPVSDSYLDVVRKLKKS